jgi:Cu+-exporting ATPase
MQGRNWLVSVSGGFLLIWTKNPLRPHVARVLRDDGETIIAVEKLRLGDFIVVLPGERMAADGVVISGESAVDESLITGESLPVL